MASLLHHIALLILLRAISWCFGRTSSLPLTISNPQEQPPVLFPPYFTKTLELYEISNHFINSQGSARVLGETFGVPQSSQSDEYISALIKFDARLLNWEKSFPDALKLESYERNDDSIQYRQAVFLRFRYAQIFFF